MQFDDASDALRSVVLGALKTGTVWTRDGNVIPAVFTGPYRLGHWGGMTAIAGPAAPPALWVFDADLSVGGFLSIRLARLNLLPLCMPNGRHMMYYLWQLLTGKPVSLEWMKLLQKWGLKALVVWSLLTLINDGIGFLQ